MKKAISAIMAAAIAFSGLGALSSSAIETYGTSGKNILVLGDSIASGYGLSKEQYNYGEIIADYVNGNLENLAVAGFTTEDMLNVIDNLSAEQKMAAASADTIIISIGGNDIIQFASKSLLALCAELGMLNSEYTAADIPERPTIADLKKMIDKQALFAYISNTKNLMTVGDKLSALACDISFTVNDQNYQKYQTRLIEQQIIPAIEKARDEIKAINPNAKIIVQTIYNPLQFESTYFNQTYDANQKRLLTYLITTFRQVLISYKKQISAIEGIEVADIYTDFASANGEDTYGWYFTNIQKPIAEMDIHPNQKGHLAIAANILDVMGEGKEEGDGGLLRQIYTNLSDKDSYPEYALQKINNKKGSYLLGDVTDDGFINAEDASAVLADYVSTSTTVGNKHIFNETQIKAGDADASEGIESSDASYILAYYSRISTGGNESFKQFIMESKK